MGVFYDNEYGTFFLFGFYGLNKASCVIDYPLNLSILISGGKETNWDSLSKGD